MAGVEPALGFLLLFPPPAPGPLGLAGRYCTRAGRTTDREKASIVQGVTGDPAIADENYDAIPRPVEQRVYLDYLILEIKPDAACVCTLERLVSTQSRNPGRSTGKCATERLHLAQSAASDPSFNRSAEAVSPITLNKLFKACPVRR
jgi:hypothetical protein